MSGVQKYQKTKFLLRRHLIFSCHTSGAQNFEVTLDKFDVVLTVHLR